jgi:hypothetical protein
MTSFQTIDSNCHCVFVGIQLLGFGHELYGVAYAADAIL